MGEKELKKKVKTVKKILRIHDIIMLIALVFFAFYIGMLVHYFISKNNEDIVVDNSKLYSMERIQIFSYPDRDNIYQIMLQSSDGTLYTVLHVEERDLVKFNERVNLLINEN